MDEALPVLLTIYPVSLIPVLEDIDIIARGWHAHL